MNTEALEDQEEEISEGDYIFIIDREGNLKSYALPESLTDFDEVPNTIMKIMKIFKTRGSPYLPQTIH